MARPVLAVEQGRAAGQTLLNLPCLGAEHLDYVAHVTCHAPAGLWESSAVLSIASNKVEEHFTAKSVPAPTRPTLTDVCVWKGRGFLQQGTGQAAADRLPHNGPQLHTHTHTRTCNVTPKWSSTGNPIQTPKNTKRTQNSLESVRFSIGSECDQR